MLIFNSYVYQRATPPNSIWAFSKVIFWFVDSCMMYIDIGISSTPRKAYSYNVIDEYAKPPPHRVDSWKKSGSETIESNQTEQRLISNQSRFKLPSRARLVDPPSRKNRKLLPQAVGTFIIPGWCFGTWIIFFPHHIGNVMIPTDEVIFFRRVGSTTNQILFIHFYGSRMRIKDEDHGSYRKTPSRFHRYWVTLYFHRSPQGRKVVKMEMFTMSIIHKYCMFLFSWLSAPQNHFYYSHHIASAFSVHLTPKFEHTLNNKSPFRS